MQRYAGPGQSCILGPTEKREYLKENLTHLALFEGLEDGAEAAEGDTYGVIAIL